MGKRRRAGLSEQLTFGRYWGQRRKGGGRKRSSDSGVSHLRREEVDGRHPVHVTLKVVPGLPRLRRRVCLEVIAEALDKARSRAGRLPGGEFRLVHYSIQDDHLHLIVEAKDRMSLSRGMQGLSIRVARGLNGWLGPEGPIVAARSWLLSRGWLRHGPLRLSGP